MPLYIADYRLDTARLSAAEHGAYLLLIMEYWASGSLPDDDRQLARIACMTDREWKAAKPIVRGFFQDGWKHHRIDAELAKAEDKHKRRAAAGSAGGNAKAAKAKPPSNASSNATASVHSNALPSSPDLGSSGDDASAPKAILDRMTEELAQAGGKALNWTVAGLFVLSVPIGWKQQGCDWQLDVLPTIAAVSARAGPSSIASWSYFTRAVTEARDRRTKPLPEIEVRHDNPGSSKPAMLDAADRLIARTDEAAFGSGPGRH
jgi:uncharacterized protein YdaU (DUF1376 family)